MSFGKVLGNLLLGPLELLFETIFALSSRVLSVGLSIVALSLAVNILAHPLYQRADAIQAKEREKEASLEPWVRRIKAAFRGNERYMMLQTYYRQNDYSPMYGLKSALPLLLQIPFFIAAYRFLSQLGSLQGAALGPIRDLSQPDGLISLGGLTLNVLPILMTVINLLSAALYLKGAPAKSWVQTVVLALVFLVWLYPSPAGLAFYWTLNNVFSLGKNLIRRLMSERKRKPHRVPKALQGAPRPAMFLLCMLVITVLTGLLIPSAYLADSPQEFVELHEIHPLWYAANALLVAAGTFLLWAGVYYVLGTDPVKRGMELGGWVLAGLFLVNYLFFRNNMGWISTTLQYDVPPEFSAAQKLINLGALALTAAVLLPLALKKEKLVRALALVLVMVMGGMSARNLWITWAGAEEVYRVLDRDYTGSDQIPVSREGKNVVVLMLDRAISSYLPCILAERPELKDTYSGFVYYPNTLSFGTHTNLGAPALFGGYEYTPKAINDRPEESLLNKHNEALLLLPTLFSQEGYRVTVFDLPYVGDYQEPGDYTIFDDLPNTNARIVRGASEANGIYERGADIRLRNMFCYSLAMVVPSAAFGTVYNMGNYNRPEGAVNLFSVHEGLPVYRDLEVTSGFRAEYEDLRSMAERTVLTEDGMNTLLVMDNQLPHVPALLKEPEYEPGDLSGNAAYDEEHADRYLAGPFELKVNTNLQRGSYHVNMASILLVGQWLDRLRELGVYDNTRIIIVADHGFWLRQIEEGLLEDSNEDIMQYNPLLMVKDFNAQGEIRTDTTFMTNADTPSLALEGLIKDPVNPFTGNPVTSEAKKEVQYVSTSREYETGWDAGNLLKAEPWYLVTPGGETLFDQDRWQLLTE